jgi:hypothetical protein
MLDQLAEGKAWLLGSMAFLGIYLIIVIRVLTSKRDYRALERMALEDGCGPDTPPAGAQERGCSSDSSES